MSKYKITVQAVLQAAKFLPEPHQNENALEHEGWAATDPTRCCCSPIDYQSLEGAFFIFFERHPK